MNNLIKLVKEKDIKDYVNNLWKTEDFKKSATDKNGFIKDWINKFAKSPRLFFSMDNERAEKGHFTSWMNCVCLRDYQNHTIQDLYYLHEILHAATMPYIPNMNFENWKLKMFKNELTTSLYSEVLVYFHLPDLRCKSFNFSIWADSFLNKKSDFKAPNFFSFLESERQRIYNSPNPRNSAELEIAKYQIQNKKWADIWKDQYNEIESFMSYFYKKASESKDQASEDHHQWILEQIKKGGQSYPFPKQAEKFSKVYWNDKK